jgi:hypothetical protein
MKLENMARKNLISRLDTVISLFFPFSLSPNLVEFFLFLFFSLKLDKSGGTIISVFGILVGNLSFLRRRPDWAVSFLCVWFSLP